MTLPSNLSIVAKASRPKIDDPLLDRDISDNPSGMYSSEIIIFEVRNLRKKERQKKYEISDTTC